MRSLIIGTMAALFLVASIVGVNSPAKADLCFSNAATYQSSFVTSLGTCDPLGNLNVNLQAGNVNITFPSVTANPHLLTSASPTAVTSILVGTLNVFTIINANAAAQTATLTLYDEGAAPTGAAADARLTIVLGVGSAGVVPLGAVGLQFVNGLAYKLSAALNTGSPVVIQANQ